MFNFKKEEKKITQIETCLSASWLSINESTFMSKSGRKSSDNFKSAFEWEYKILNLWGLKSAKST